MKNNKIKRILALTSVAALSIALFAGCGQKKAEDKTSNEAATKKVSTLKGEVEIPTHPKRIVDISGSSEALTILGETPVGTANVDSYKTTEVPEYMKDKLGSVKVVGHSMAETADVEAIIGLNPDLIIMSQRQEKIYDQLKAVAPVVELKEYNNDWKENFKDVAKLLDKDDVANQWIKDYEAKSEKIGKEIADKNGANTTYFTVLASAGKYYVFSTGGLGSMLYDDLKLAKPSNMPAQDGITLPVITLEGISDIKADHLIVITTDQEWTELQNNEVFKNLPQVKSGKVTMLSSAPYFAQGYQPIGKDKLLDGLTDKLSK